MKIYPYIEEGEKFQDLKFTKIWKVGFYKENVWGIEGRVAVKYGFLKMSSGKRSFRIKISADTGEIWSCGSGIGLDFDLPRERRPTLLALYPSSSPACLVVHDLLLGGADAGDISTSV